MIDAASGFFKPQITCLPVQSLFSMLTLTLRGSMANGDYGWLCLEVEAQKSIWPKTWSPSLIFFLWPTGMLTYCRSICCHDSLCSSLKTLAIQWRGEEATGEEKRRGEAKGEKKIEEEVEGGEEERREKGVEEMRAEQEREKKTYLQLIMRGGVDGGRCLHLSTNFP
jgi:hypothetical protein